MRADPRDTGREAISENMTDDRGVYRIYGVPAGRYTVAAGDPRYAPPDPRAPTTSPCYADVTDAAKAGVVEVKEGTEATKIDITIGEAPTGYGVAGRVIDGDSGTPIAKAYIQLTRIEIIDASNSRGYGEYV